MNRHSSADGSHGLAMDYIAISLYGGGMLQFPAVTVAAIPVTSEALTEEEGGTLQVLGCRECLGPLT